MKGNRRQCILGCLLIAFIVLAMVPEETMAASFVKTKVTEMRVTEISHDSVKISWKKVKGAEFYQVYRAGSKNGKYKKIITTKKLKAVSGKLTTGKPYYYKVRACRKTGGTMKYGKFSTAKKAVPKLSKPSIKASSGETRIRLSWKSVKGAKGYQVYRAEAKGGTYAKIVTTKKTSFTDTSAEAGKRYCYKVRAYKKSGGRMRYSAFSTAKSGKTKEGTSAADPDAPAREDSEQTHEHKWEPVYEEQVTHTKEEKFFAAVCNQCGLDMSAFTEDEIWDHILGSDTCESFSTDTYREVVTEHKTRRITGYKCACGAAR